MARLDDLLSAGEASVSTESQRGAVETFFTRSRALSLAHGHWIIEGPDDVSSAPNTS